MEISVEKPQAMTSIVFSDVTHVITRKVSYTQTQKADAVPEPSTKLYAIQHNRQ